MAKSIQHPSAQGCIVSFPAPHVLLLTLNRPEKRNSIPLTISTEIQRLWDWFDTEPSLHVAIITGARESFCSGADLKEWDELNQRGVPNKMTAPGLAGLPRQRKGKPIIAAVNGYCLGGGFEMVVNCDIVIASEKASFGLPEVQRGTAAVAGSLPRLVRVIGKQRAAEIALTGLMFPASQLEHWGLVNRVVEHGQLLATAVEMATTIAGNSPDSIRVTMEGLHLGWEIANVDEASTALVDQWYSKLIAGENFHEGIRAFVEKRQPWWRPCSLLPFERHIGPASVKSILEDDTRVFQGSD